MDFIQASRIAYEYYKECWDTEGLRGAKDLGEKWIFYPDTSEPFFGDSHITVSKNEGEIELFILPDKENFALLKKAVDVEIPKEFQ